MSNTDLKILASKLEELLDAYQSLEKENQLLRAERTHWHSERKRLIQQNELARQKVEAMITRLKKMESEQ